MAAEIVEKHASELVEEYLRKPNRRKIPSILSYKIQAKFREELRPVRGEHPYPLHVENVPALNRVERKVFESVRSRTLSSR
jgi:hypothetical protein